MLDTVGVHGGAYVSAAGLRVLVGVGQRGDGREQLVPQLGRLCRQPGLHLGVRRLFHAVHRAVTDRPRLSTCVSRGLSGQALALRW